MTREALAVVGMVLLAAAAVGAQSMTWNGAADNDDWYAFNAVPDTWDPQVWVNNWGQEIYRYPGDPEPAEMTTPTGVASIPTGFLAEVASQVQVSSVELAGTLEIGASLACATLNVAGAAVLQYQGRIFGCAVQGDGPDGFLTTDAAAASTVTGPTLDTVTLSLPTLVGNDRRVFLANTIHNLGVIQLLDTAAGGESRLIVDSDVTLSGPGWLETSDSADNEIGAYFDPDDRLTNQSTIHAAGRIGANTIAVTNQGLIVADLSTMLTVDPSDTPDDGQPGVVNQGVLRAASGGTLRLERGAFSNAAGVIEALDGSAVELGRAALLGGGQLHTQGSGVIRSSHDAANTTTDPQVRDLTVAGTLQVPDGKRLEVAGTVTVSGQLRLDAAGGMARLVVDSPTTLAGSGRLETSDDDGNEIRASELAHERLTLAVETHAAGALGDGLIAMTNQALIVADRATPLVVHPTGSANDGQPGFVNHGTLRAAPGSTLRLFDGDFANAGGVIESQAGGLVELDSDADVSGGTLRGLLRSVASFHPPTVAGAVNEGRVEVPATADLWLEGTLTNHGVVSADGGSILPSGNVELSGGGVLELTNGAEVSADGLGVGNGASHTIVASGAGQNAFREELTNLGSVVVASGSSLRFYAPYLPAAGSTTRVEGTLQPSGPLTLAGTLTGNGVVNGSVVVTSDGVLAPGGGYGALTTGSLTIESGAVYRWETSPAVGNDVVDVNGALDLGTATLNVDLRVASGAVPSRVELFEYTTLAATPDPDQIVLAAGATFIGLDTAGNRLALVGVAHPGRIFADDLESGDPSGWSAVVGGPGKRLVRDPAGGPATASRPSG